MRSYPRLISQALAATAVGALLASCSIFDEPQPERVSPVSPVSPTASPPGPSGTPQAAPPGMQLSPSGVTTAVDAPAASTEDEYYDACHTARVWMTERGGHAHNQIEPYLAVVQASATGGPGTWHTPWSQMPPERQSAVIVAVTAAANGDCD